MLVTINDVPVAGDPSATLSLIDPNVVERVEITTRINVLYGTQGYFGVIAVYLKSGINEAEKTPIESKSFSVAGFDRPRAFKAPRYPNDSSMADYRATIYWNPEVVLDETGSAVVTFYSADLETQYKVVVEGITAKNEPVRAEYYVTIEND